MSREGSSVYIADGFADDCEELIHRCSRVQELTYNTFCNIYRDMKFDGLYGGRTTAAEIAELSEEILHVAKHYMVTDTNNFEESVAGLFLVYVLLNTQPFPMLASLRLVPDDVAAINRIQLVARKEKRLDVLYTLGHILVKGPCQLHATARECGLEPALRKYFGKTASMDHRGLRPMGVFQRQNQELDGIRRLANIDRHYIAGKARIQGGITDRNLSYCDSGFVTWLDMSLRKLVNGITDDGVSIKDRSEKVNAIKDRAMKVAVNSVGHLTGINERAKPSPKKPASVQHEFVPPKSPAKRYRNKDYTKVPLIGTPPSGHSNEWEVPVIGKNDTIQKDSTQTVSYHQLLTHGLSCFDESSHEKDSAEPFTGGIEDKCNGNDNKLDMMILDDSDEVRHVKNNNVNKVAIKDCKQIAKTTVCIKKGDFKTTSKKIINYKLSKNNVCEEKSSKKRKMSSRSSKSAKSKKKKAKSFASSDSDSESDIDLELDDSEDDLYSVTDDVDNLIETIDDDIKRLENDTQCQRMTRTRKIKTDDTKNITETNDMKKLEENRSPETLDNDKHPESKIAKKNETSNKTESTRKTRENETDTPTNIENEDKNETNIDDLISQHLKMSVVTKKEIHKRKTRRSSTRKSETSVTYLSSNINNDKNYLQSEKRKPGSRRNENDVLNSVNDQEIDKKRCETTRTPETTNKKGNERSRTRESKTEINVDDLEKSRKSLDEIINENMEKGDPLLIQTDGDEFIQIDIVDSVDDTAPNNKDKIDKVRSLRTRQVNTTKSSAEKVNSPKSPAKKVNSPKSPAKKVNSPKSPAKKVNSPTSKAKSLLRKTSTEKSPVKKENRPKKQNELVEKQNSPKTRSNLKDTNVLPIDKNNKSPKITSNKNNIQNSPKTPDNLVITPIVKKQKSFKKTSHVNKTNSPKAPIYYCTERCTRSRVTEDNIVITLPEDVTLKIDKRNSTTMPPHSTSYSNKSPGRGTVNTMSPDRSTVNTISPRRSTVNTISPRRSTVNTMSPGVSTLNTMSPRRSPRTQNMAQLSLVKSPGVNAYMLRKREAPESKVKGKTKVKSRFKRMGILPIANFKEEVSE